LSSVAAGITTPGFFLVARQRANIVDANLSRRTEYATAILLDDTCAITAFLFWSAAAISAADVVCRTELCAGCLYALFRFCGYLDRG
jgi:hypothetical protein